MSIKPANIIIDENGSVRASDFNDQYFMPEKGVEESEYVFIQPSNFNTEKQTNVLELGFGTGLNFLLTLHHFKDNPSNLHFISIEKHPIKKDDLIKIYKFFPDFLKCDEIINQYPDIAQGVHTLNINGSTLTLYFDDVRNCIANINENIDSIYLDGFAPSRNSDMWETELFAHCQKILKPNGIITTFSASSLVQKNMEQNNLFVKKRTGFGSKRECLIATKYPIHIPETIKDIAIVGAGITGLTIAYELKNCEFNITLYDKDGILSGASGNPYALIDPRFLNGETGDAVFNKNAYLYATDYYTEKDCWAVHGLTKFENERVDMGRLQSWITNIDPKHITPTEKGIELPTSGAVDTKKVAGFLAKDITFKKQKITDTKELNADLVIFCCGAETGEITNIPYTINRGVVGMTVPVQPNPKAVSKMGYYINTLNLTLFGATSTRVEKVAPYNPTDTDKKELIKKIADLITIPENTKIEMRHGYRCNTKHRIPTITQINNNTLAVLGMGSRGYTNAPYTAHILKNLLLKNIDELDKKILKLLTI